MNKTTTTGKRIHLIVAMTSDYIIGYSNQLPWRFSLDLKRFRKITTPHTVIMGRKTFESIGRPLPKRENIVVTTQKRYRADGCLVASSLRNGIDKASRDSKIFVIGGGQLYREAMPIADKIYLTVIDIDRARGQGVLFKPFRGDTHFPPINGQEWKLISRGVKRRAFPYSHSTLSNKESDIAPAIYFRFVVLERRKRTSSNPIPGVTDSEFDISWSDKNKLRREISLGQHRRATRKKRISQRDLFSD